MLALGRKFPIEGRRDALGLERVGHRLTREQAAPVAKIDANRRNAHSRNGPKTEAGNRHCRGNAVRLGLTAETVIEVLEDPEDCKAFQLSVASDFYAQTAVERELVLRLAGLLWRLRRATAIETGMFQIHSATTVEVSVGPGPHRRRRRTDV